MSTRTDEASWTTRERATAATVRASGKKLVCRIEGGRRVFTIIEAEEGAQPMLRTVAAGGEIKIGAGNCTIKLTGKPKK